MSEMSTKRCISKILRSLNIKIVSSKSKKGYPEERTTIIRIGDGLEVEIISNRKESEVFVIVTKNGVQYLIDNHPFDGDSHTRVLLTDLQLLIGALDRGWFNLTGKKAEERAESSRRYEEYRKSIDPGWTGYRD
jgi:hypothetical protein